VLGHALGFAFKEIIWLADLQLGLNQALYGAVADGALGVK
jgi:hypothetical protein